MKALTRVVASLVVSAGLIGLASTVVEDTVQFANDRQWCC